MASLRENTLFCYKAEQESSFSATGDSVSLHDRDIQHARMFRKRQRKHMVDGINPQRV